MPTEFLEAYLHATDAQRAAALDALKGNTAAGLTSDKPLPRVISAKALAEIANVTTRSLRRYAKQGLLKTAHFATGKRGWGYTEESARAFLERASTQDEKPAAAAEPVAVEVIEN